MVQTAESWPLQQPLESMPIRDLWRPWGRITRELLARVGGEIRLWIERDRRRRELAELPREALRDIGLTPEEVRIEWAKPFWQE